MSDKETEALLATQQRLLALSRWENEGGAVLGISQATFLVENEERAVHQVPNSDKVMPVNRP